MTDHEQRLAASSQVRHCIGVHSQTMAVLLSLSWWADRMRFLAMEADVFAMQQLRITVPRSADMSLTLAARHSGIAVTLDPFTPQSHYQLAPSPVWVASCFEFVQYRELALKTRATNEAPLVCKRVQFDAVTHGAILTDDDYVASFLREKSQTESSLMEGIHA